MLPSGSAHDVGASRPGGLGSGINGNGYCVPSASTPFAARAVSIASSVLACTGVSLTLTWPVWPPLQLGGQVPSPSLPGQHSRGMSACTHIAVCRVPAGPLWRQGLGQSRWYLWPCSWDSIAVVFSTASPARGKTLNTIARPVKR
jgi:hypothetical protein